MKIAIVNTFAPFIHGGAEYLAEGLCQKIKERGHKAMIIKVPLSWHPAHKIPENILSARLLHLEFNVDKVIALKFPAYYVKHHNKVVWLLHQFRQAYDLWGTPYQDIPNTPEGHSIRQMIINSDNAYLPEAKKIYTNSIVTSNRLRQFNQLESEVLHPPLLQPNHFYCDQFDDYLFFPSRISAGKRQYLAIEAMRFTRSAVKLMIAGNPDQPNDLLELQERIERYQLQHKVQVLGEHISEQKKIRLLANCLGCVYIPYDEDSYGYVTLEAFHAKKPVVTCTDSGGILTIVRDQQTGFVREPDAKELASTFDQLHSNKALAQELGQNAHRSIHQLGITWEHVLGKLLS